MALFDPSIFDAYVFDTSQLAAASIPLPPPTPLPTFMERHFTAVVPMSVPVSQPFTATMPIQVDLRVPYKAYMRAEKGIRHQFTESFLASKSVINLTVFEEAFDASRVVVTPELKKLLRLVREQMMEL